MDPEDENREEEREDEIDGEPQGVVDPEPVDADPDPAPVDHSACEAKIAQLEAALIAKDGEIAAIQADLTATKAHNYDLLTAVPTDDEPITESVDDDNIPDLDDFFTEEKAD